MSTKAVSRRMAARKQQARKRMLLLGAGLAFALAGWIVFNIFGAVGGGEAVTASGVLGTQIGDTAPDFNIPTLAGDAFSLAAQRGKPTIVFFMAYWCGTCIPEARALAQLKQEYGDSLNIIAIDVDPSSTPDLLASFKQTSGGEAYAWAFDPGQQVAAEYEVLSLDTTLILDADGMVVYRDEFPSTYNTLKDGLAQGGL